MTVDMSWLESPKRGEKTMFYRSGGAKMKKNVCVFLLIVALVLSLTACSHDQISVTDVSILPTGDISGAITPDKDMSEVMVCVVAKDSTDKVNFEGTIQLSETFSKDVKTTFSFDIFDTRMWSDARTERDTAQSMLTAYKEIVADEHQVERNKLTLSKAEKEPPAAWAEDPSIRPPAMAGVR